MSYLPHTSSSRRDYQEGMQLAPPSLSICVTGVMSQDGLLQITRNLPDDRTWQGTLRYRIFRPRQLRKHPPPLVVLHGGPSIPSNYLLPLVNVVTDRAILFYDMIGCGRSSRPTEPEAYSIDLCVQDLQALLKHWNLLHFHLYGHSFGGILAFEYLKATRDSTCCSSVILSSAPTSIALINAESQRLLQELKCELEYKDEEEDNKSKREVLERFRQRHECRSVPTPLSLVDAQAQAGTVWRGTEAIPNYQATLGDSHEPLSQPALTMRGQYDFCTETCVEGWKDFFRDAPRTMVLASCSHHGLLENEQLYGAVISSFLVDHDPKAV